MQDFRRCQALIQQIGAVATPPDHSFPPTRPDVAQHHALAAKNTQRGLAAKVQELSATFRKKQRVYMESELLLPQCSIPTLHTSYPRGSRASSQLSASNIFTSFRSAELQGHAIKNQDLLVASGVTSLKGTDALTAVDEDIEAAVWAPFSFCCIIGHVLTRPSPHSSRVVSWLTNSSSSQIFERVTASSPKLQSQSPPWRSFSKICHHSS